MAAGRSLRSWELLRNGQEDVCASNIWLSLEKTHMVLGDVHTQWYQWIKALLSSLSQQSYPNLERRTNKMEKETWEIGEPMYNKSSQAAWPAALRCSQLAIPSIVKKTHLFYN